MKKLLLITVLTFSSVAVFGQGQIGNGDMEAWANNDEPDNWNSFLTGSGQWSGFASDQCDASTDVRPGSAGTSSCRIWSESTFGIVANGNVTLGRINMGSTTPSSPDNYNYSVTADPEFSEALTDTPDSIVFWAKFTPNGGNGNARMKATLHTNYDYRDPEDAASSNEVVAQAVLNYPSTGGNWMRFSVPFNYSGPATVNEFILVTFTTNETPGGGDANDEVLIDDVELIYNSGSVSSVDLNDLQVYVSNEANTLNFSSSQPIFGSYEVYDISGALIMEGTINGNVSFDVPTGIYFVKTVREGVMSEHKVFKK